MTTLTEYTSAHSTAAPTTPAISTDFAVVGLWALLGLSIVAILAVSGLLDIAVLQAMAG